MERLEGRVMLAAFDVLVFSKTAGFRHESIPEGIAAITSLGAAHDFSVVATEDASVFTGSNLADYEAVVFLNTTGDVLNAAQQTAFEQYIQAGGGWVGVHSAADTEYGWSWYGELLGAYFQSHPAIQQATIVVEDGSHPSTNHLPAEWTRTDEWYNFQTNPRGDVNVLLTLDESTYSGGADGPDHPIAWYHEYEGGRAWYTGLGHTDASYSEPLFRNHLLGGIQYAAGQAPGEPSADFDADGAVDGSDFLRWQRGAGTIAGATRADGDANLDGRVDGQDLADWKQTFSGSAPLATTSNGAQLLAVDAAFSTIDRPNSDKPPVTALTLRREWAGLSLPQFPQSSSAIDVAELSPEEFDVPYESRPPARRYLLTTHTHEMQGPHATRDQGRRAKHTNDFADGINQRLAIEFDDRDHSFLFE